MEIATLFPKNFRRKKRNSMGAFVQSHKKRENEIMFEFPLVKPAAL